MTYRILITGSRAWDDYEVVLEALRGAADGHEDVIVVHGGATGADSLAAYAAYVLGLEPEEHLADWGRYGKKAGIIRNDLMVSLGADICLAFCLPCWRPPCAGLPEHDTHGTGHCILAARFNGIPVIRI